GPDYPFNGGTARVAGLTCCSTLGWKVPTIVSTGHAGAMRDLISSADLALANMEESAPDHFTYHPTGTSFTGDPALIAGIARAGIDVASCASTHIGDGGPAGILQTVRSLKKYGIVPFGAGPNLAAARRPAIFTDGGVKVAIIPATTAAFLRRAWHFYAAHGITVERILTDNGSPYISRLFAEACDELGIGHRRTAACPST